MNRKRIAFDTATCTKNRRREENNFLCGISTYILPTGIGSPRCKLFQTQLEKFGGKLNTSVKEGVDYVIVDDSLTWDKICNLLKWNDKKLPFENIKIVTTAWLSACLEQKCLVESSVYEIERKSDQCNKYSDTSGTSNVKEQSTISEGDCTQVEKNSSKTKLIVPGKWVCAHPSSETNVNLNAHITEQLQILAETYKNTKDHWRALTYERAIGILKKYPTEITTREEAKAIYGIGNSLCDKICEIILSGNLRKAEEFSADEELKAISLFTKVWGAGPATAAIWVKQGFRTLEDLKERAKLTRNQQIGIKYFEDLLEKMPREEAEIIVETVKAAVMAIDPTYEVIGCGSYRRLKPLCGDVDILISRKDGNPHVNILGQLISALHMSGFLTDDLIGSAEMGAENTYMGICQLPGEEHKHRRIDIFEVRREQFACALLAYTGSGHFNRSMRLLARKKGMSLSHHSLNDGVTRKGEEKLHDGHPLPTPTEKSIFEHLGLDYRPPEERDH